MIAEFHPLADRELTDAALFYEGQAQGLGADFLDEVEHVVSIVGPGKSAPAPTATVLGGARAMKLNYYADTDSLYIDLSERTSVESREVSEGVVLDYDDAGRLVGIDIDNASTKALIHHLVLNRLPATIETIGD